MDVDVDGDDALLDSVVFAYLSSKGKRYEPVKRKLAANAKLPSIEYCPPQSKVKGVIESVLVSNVAARVHPASFKPERLSQQYNSLLRWINRSLEQYQQELANVAWPAFLHCFLELIVLGFPELGREFLAQHSANHRALHAPEIALFEGIVTPRHIRDSQLASAFRKTKYLIRLSDYSSELLASLLQEKRNSELQRIVHDHIDVIAVQRKADSGLPNPGLLGDIGPEVEALNRTRVNYGIGYWVEDEEAAAAEGEAAEADPERKVKKRAKPATAGEAPPSSMPWLPEVQGYDLHMRREALKDWRKAVEVDAKRLPSSLFYTFFDGPEIINDLTISPDATLISAACADSGIEVHDLTSKGLMNLYPEEKLEKMPIGDLEYTALFDPSTAQPKRRLIGHSGPVYKTAFALHNQLLYSASEDASVRLWSLSTYECLAKFKGHNFPVWGCDANPMGPYVASCSADRTCRVWNTEYIQAVRVFAGHHLDVNAVKFHPNGHYLATASDDRSCILWDLASGKKAREFHGHTDVVHTLAFSKDGRFLASAGDDCNIFIWDVGTGREVSTFIGHEDVTHSLSFSCEDSLLASGGADHTVRLWDLKATAQRVAEATGALASEVAAREKATATLFTRDTPVFACRFGPTNVLVAAGVAPAEM